MDNPTKRSPATRAGQGTGLTEPPQPSRAYNLIFSTCRGVYSPSSRSRSASSRSNSINSRAARSRRSSGQSRTSSISIRLIPTLYQIPLRRPIGGRGAYSNQVQKYGSTAPYSLLRTLSDLRSLLAYQAIKNAIVSLVVPDPYGYDGYGARDLRNLMAGIPEKKRRGWWVARRNCVGCARSRLRSCRVRRAAACARQRYRQP